MYKDFTTIHVTDVKMLIKPKIMRMVD